MRPSVQSASLLLAFVLCLAGTGLATQEEGAEKASPRTLPPMVDKHRPLRGHPPLSAPAEARDNTSVTATPEEAGFSVVPRIPSLSAYPCKACHQYKPPNLQKRQLYSPHVKEVVHGEEQFWCHDCHDPEEKSQLKTLAGEVYDFDTAYQVCAQCHYEPRRDWLHGAHGKRVANWDGERQIYSCTHCHNPHNPEIRPRPPQPPPPLRQGLERRSHHSQEAPGAPVTSGRDADRP